MTAPSLTLAAAETAPPTPQQAVESLNSVAAQLPAESLNHQFVAAITRLAEGEFFAPRASACGLLPVAHKGCRPEVQATLRGLFAKLSTDETPMVRRAAASALGGIAGSCTPDVVKAELLSVYTTLVGDEQDTVRQLVVGGAPALCKVLKATDSVAEVISSLHIASKVSGAAPGGCSVGKGGGRKESRCGPSDLFLATALCMRC